MRYSWVVVLAGLPLMAGAALPPHIPSPPAESSDIISVNFIDRILKDSQPRQRSTAHKRPSRAAQARQPAPAVPGAIPVPTQRPTEDAGKAAEPVQPPATSPKTSLSSPSEPATPIAPEPAQPAPAPAQAQAQAQASSPAPTVQQPATVNEPAHPAEVPKPLPKPEEQPQAESTETSPPPAANGAAPDAAKTDEAPPVPQEAQPSIPDAPPVPAPAPAGGQTEPPAETPKEEPAQQEPPPVPIASEDPEELKACLADLAALGARFTPIDRIDDGEGCGIDKPIELAEVLPGVDTGGAKMRCKTAQALGHWLKDTVQPALNIAIPGRRITGLVPGSTYACRLRNNATTGKVSEHAHGNAFDVAAFNLDNGDRIEMKPRDDDHTLEGAFQKTATAGACLHFTTVLAPGSDAAHETHLHLDVIERNGAYRICE